MKHNLFFINAFFFIAILISLIAIRELINNSAEKPKINNPLAPDAYMINAYLFQTNEIGQREVTLFSPYATHYQVENSSHFQKPVIHLYRNGEEWQVTANHAKGVHGATTFYLYDNVKAKQLPTKKSPGSVLLTKSLTVFPKLDLVETKDPITILQPGLKIKAIGLKGDLKTGNITLLSKTRGEYDPRQSR